MIATSKKGLHHHVADFISEMKRLCPDSTIEVSYEPYETEDAHLIVRVPENWTDEQCERLEVHAAKMHCNLLLETGLSILALVIEPQERIRREVEAHQKKQLKDGVKSGVPKVRQLEKKAPKSAKPKRQGSSHKR